LASGAHRRRVENPKGDGATVSSIERKERGDMCPPKESWMEKDDQMHNENSEFPEAKYRNPKFLFLFMA